MDYQFFADELENEGYVTSETLQTGNLTSKAIELNLPIIEAEARKGDGLKAAVAVEQARRTCIANLDGHQTPPFGKTNWRRLSSDSRHGEAVSNGSEAGVDAFPLHAAYSDREASMSTLAVRRLFTNEGADYREIRLSALQSAPDAFGATYDEEAGYSIEEFQRRVEEATVFGAYWGNDIVGMVGFTRQSGSKSAHKGQIWGMFVSPDRRGQKVGAELVDAVLAHAQPLVELLQLKVIVSNAAAISLYRAKGFEIYGTERHAMKTAGGYLDEHLMMRSWLR